MKISYCLIWLPFFIAPFLTPNIPLNYLSFSTLSFATGLLMAAWIWSPDDNTNENDIFPYIFISLCIVPILILLIKEDLRTPWHAFQGCLYITAAWLIYQMSKKQAAYILTSNCFLILITIIAYIYVIFSLLQAWDMRFFVGDRLFPVWTSISVTRPLSLAEASLFLS